MLPEMSPREKAATWICGALICWGVIAFIIFMAFGVRLSVPPCC